MGIPGVVGMLELAHQKYGKLPWAKLFEPAIKLAEDGFPVGPKLARTIKNFTRGANMPDIKAHFYHPDGTPLAEGEIYKNPEYAATLRMIAADGPKAFYTGEIAQAIVDAVQHAPRQSGRHDPGRPGQLSRRWSARRCAATIASGISARWARPVPAASPLCRSWACCSVSPRRSFSPTR